MGAAYLADNVLPPLFKHGDAASSVRLISVTAVAAETLLPEEWAGAYVVARAESTKIWILFVQQSGDHVSSADTPATKIGRPIEDGTEREFRVPHGFPYISLQGGGNGNLRIWISSQAE